MKIGRNDPCWCGSGKKYKSCHAAFDDKLAAYQLKHIPVPSHKLIKTPEQLEGIRKAGKLNTAILDMVAENIKAGMSTDDINTLVHNYTVEHGGIPAPLGYQGFPKSVCTSVNDAICHGIPDPNQILQDGDIIESHYAVTRRNRTIYKRMREYLYELTHRDDLVTAVLPVGDGITVSTKVEENERH